MNSPDLEALYAAPPADMGPTSPRDELLAAARVLRHRDDWLSGQLLLWLIDTAGLHGPDEAGHCFRDLDVWPCSDVQAAQKVAFAVGYQNPTNARSATEEADRG